MKKRLDGGTPELTEGLSPLGRCRMSILVATGSIPRQVTGPTRRNLRAILGGWSDVDTGNHRILSAPTLDELENGTYEDCGE